MRGMASSAGARPRAPLELTWLACVLAGWSLTSVPVAGGVSPACAAASGRAVVAAGGAMGRRKNSSKKGTSVNAPTWEERDDISPFKLAEKRFKRYKGRSTDLSGVLDLSSPAAAGPRGEECGETDGGAAGVRVEQVPGRDGLLILPGFLTEDEQLVLAQKCLAEYPSPKHRSNLTPHHGCIDDLWETRPDLLEQLRWVTLGYQYDWTNRTYAAADHVRVPSELRRYAREAGIAAAGQPVAAEAVIVNYYSLSSTLGGHLDDVEPDQVLTVVVVTRKEYLTRKKYLTICISHAGGAGSGKPDCVHQPRVCSRVFGGRELKG